ncbi:MAG TPA: prepilin-type N-terminal cleavage/methylation domain-containing protein [Candidatus Bathyarchaeia archaeon]|nr:prepilin-type N-terminal cleavage/methylation domain-containing protein [Candidatus Bathyarchaeia archaeon]
MSAQGNALGNRTARDARPEGASQIPHQKRQQAAALHTAPGFTLAEMLVAVAVLMVLMAGFTMLFTGSVRTVRSSLQQTDAFDRAGGALSSIKADLLTSFNGRDAGNKFSFYGTPIGMTFVGLVKNRSEYAGYDNTATPMQNTDLRLARVTYVLHHGGSYEYFPAAMDGADAFSHRLLRYVEMNAADLDTFPVQWDTTMASETDTIMGVIDGELLEYLLAHPDQDTPEFADSYRRAKKCEFWIRMLAGGDDQVPNAWSSPATYLGRGIDDLPQDGSAYLQFVLTDSVVTTVPPFDIPEYPVPGYRTYPFSGLALFDYDYARPQENPLSSNIWWNDPRSINCWGGNSFCSDTSLPEIVSVSMWLMFKAPYPSAPDFQKLFTMQVNLPAAYTRQAVIEGRVYQPDNNDQGVSGVPMNVWPDPGVEVTTDVTGYYSVAVSSGWSGSITVPLEPVDDDCADCVKTRSYTNVTTQIKDQNYAVE